MDSNQDELTFIFEEDGAEVLNDFVKHVANRGLLYYKSIIQTGSKAGESLWTHVMNLVMVVEKLRPLLELEEKEMRCLLLALVIHDLNKLSDYGKLPSGKQIRYAQVTLPENIRKVLNELNVRFFFPDWETYLKDIKYLADAHQEKATLDSQHNQKLMDECVLDQDRLKGPLTYLMKAADVSDNSHSGDYTSRHERHIRGQVMEHLNTALSQGGLPRRYRFIGYRFAEFRGLQTNIIQKMMITFLRTTYGKEACVDLLYHAEGTDLLLDQRVRFTWPPQMQRQLAKEISHRFADLQVEKLAQFIKAKPSGIAVNSAATESGAPLEEIFQTLVGVVVRKKYPSEWREERQMAVRKDLETFLAQNPGQKQTVLKQQVLDLVAEAQLVPADEEQIKRGEFLMAYRNFLKDHRKVACRLLKQDPWQRASRAFHLPEQMDAVYLLIHSYRRGYAMARDLPAISLEAMMQAALDDLAQLDQQAKTSAAARKKAPSQPEVAEPERGQLDEALDVTAIEDYLERNLQVWDDEARMLLSPVTFHETLHRYVQDANPERQCCYCGSALKAEEWMAVQMPSSLGVQIFSNRLEGGSSREPKRNACSICRNQFILEKLAWSAHKDRHGKDEVTFYLHLFSYSFLTKPLLDAWWQSIERFRDGNYKALFFKTKEYFTHWVRDYTSFQRPVRILNHGIDGLGIPAFSEAISNTPVLSLNIPGENYGRQFLLALEKTVILANWFDCRVLLSRLPTPLMNLEHERLGEGEKSEPVALLVESVPQSMGWLLSQHALTRAQVEDLCQQLSLLHQITTLITSPDEVAESVIYRLVTAAAHDTLSLYSEVDRQIERMLAKQKGAGSEQRVLSLSARVAPLVEELLRLKEGEGVHV